MTVATESNRLSYNGNGATTAFPVTYPFLESSDLKVYVDGSLKTITTDYTISGGNGLTGTVTFVSAPAGGADIVILRDPDLTQTTDLRNQGAFFAEVHEQAFDKLTMIAQRLEDKLGQALIIPNSEQFGAELPSAANRAGKYLVFDANGDPFVSATDVQTFVDQAAASADDAEASANAAAGSASAAADSASTATGVASTINQALDSFNDALASVIPSFQQFSGNGSQTAFTLSTAPVNEDAIDVYISGVYQQKSQYSVSGVTLTFTAAPASGTNNIEVKSAGTVAYQVIGATDFGLIV